MKEFKIRVESPEHSKKIQEKLFELGYRWRSLGKLLSYLGEPFLYTKGDGTIKIGDIGDIEDDFVLHKSKEVKLVEKISYEFEEVESRKVVKVGEISYYEDELAEALKNIKPI